MKLLLISVVLLQAWCYALPKPNGLGSFAYTDSAGNRYGGTYPLDGISPFSDPIISPYSEAYIPDFYNNYNFDNMIQPFPFGGFPFGGFGPYNMNHRLTHNSAISSAAIGPGYRHQSAIINPPNAENPNIDIFNRMGETTGPGNFYSVSSSSFASSNNDNGKVTGYRGAETVVNDNGKITKYKVHS